MDEDVDAMVSVARDQVRGQRREGDEAPVGGDRGKAAVVICLRPGGADADPGRLAPHSVADEDVIPVVSVALDQVRGVVEKATKRPVAEIEIGKFEEAPDLGFPLAPAELTLTRVVFTATPAEAGTAASAKAEAVSARNRYLDRLILSFPSLPSCLEDGRRAYARVGGGVEGGGVSGNRTCRPGAEISTAGRDLVRPPGSTRHGSGCSGAAALVHGSQQPRSPDLRLRAKRSLERREVSQRRQRKVQSGP